MRGPNPRYTPVAPPVDAQGEYNIPLDDGGADLYLAPSGRYVPYQAPLPPAGPQGPPASPPSSDPTTPSDSTPPDNNPWQDVQVQTPQGWTPYCIGRGRQRTPPLLPMAGPLWPLVCQASTSRTPPLSYGSWVWTDMAMPATNQEMTWQLREYCAITPPSPPPQPHQQPTPELRNPHCFSRLRWPVVRPDNTYGDEAPVDVFGQTSNTGVLRPCGNQSPDYGQGPSKNMGLVLHP